MDPHGKRGNRAGFLVAEGLLETRIADPDSRCVGWRITDKPGISEVIYRTGLTTNHPLREFLICHHRSRRPSGDDSSHHDLHLCSDPGRYYFECLRCPLLFYVAIRVSYTLD